MKHSIKPESSDFSESMAKAIETCVHCGFCLPACPTYHVLGQEADSPRGRILLMKQVLEEQLDSEDVSQHIDQCLGCLGCETACPSGVKYRDLISPYRSTHPGRKTFFERLRERLVSWTLPYPGRFRWALRLAKWTRFLSFLIPRAIRPMTEMVPETIPARLKLKPFYAAKGPSKCRVALLAGCAQQVLAPQINFHTIQLLTHFGADVVVPPGQSCCGALAWHTGDPRQAQKLAKKNLGKFPEDVDWIVTNAAGCGSGIHEYDTIFSKTDDHDAAKSFSRKTVDISVLLNQLEFADSADTLGGNPEKLRVAYHDACHLSNGQNVRVEPRQLLQSLPGIELIPIRQSEMCCGSAGTYNIEQPEIAAKLGALKAESVVATNADILVTGNIGCIVQIQNHLKTMKSNIRVMHLVEFLSERLRLVD